MQQGDYGTRGDFFSGNDAWNMYWTFYAGKPVNRNRFRRGLLSVPEDRARSERWSEEYGEVVWYFPMVVLWRLLWWFETGVM